MLSILIGFIFSFSFFSNLSLSVEDQSFNCLKNKQCLDRTSSVLETKPLIKAEENPHVDNFKSSSSLVFSETVPTIKTTTQSASDKPIELAQSSSHRCRNAPWIDQAVVFQSVEAPQIEPLQEQYEDRRRLPYGEYDLVRGKASAVFVDIDGLRRSSAVLQAFVGYRLYYEEEIRGNQTNFPIDLPMREGGLLDGVGSARVWIRLIPDEDPSCYDQIFFKVTVWETKKLDLRFARINNRNCKPLKEYPLYNISGGSSNVIFVREDRYKNSTLSHELGHSLGQRGREFYKAEEKCKDFKYEAEEQCLGYTIGKSLKFGKIERDLLSIMHAGKFSIHQKWIDRETFQKIFVYLLKEDNRRLAPNIPNTPLSRDKTVSKDMAVKNDPIAIISGIYLKSDQPEEEKFLYDPKIEIHKEGGQLTPFIEEGDIQVELKLEEKVIYTNRLSSFAEIEFLKEGGENHKTYKLSSVPITVSLPLKYRETANYEVVIKQMINGAEKRVLFSRKLQIAE